MGQTLSVKTGLGFAVPAAISTAYEDAEDESFYDYLDGLIGYDGPLEMDLAAYYDYTPDEDGKVAYAVFLKSTVTTEYGAGVFPVAAKPLTRGEEGYRDIIELADTLDVKFDKLEWLMVVSLG